MEKFELSKYQKEIIDYVENYNTNLLIDAKAGSGKTSTLILIANNLQEHYNQSLFLSFNKSIVEELQQKLPNNTVKTVHSLGLSFIRSYLYKKHNKNYNISIDTAKIRNLCKSYYDEHFKSILENEYTETMSSTDLKTLHTTLIGDFVTVCNFVRIYALDYHDFLNVYRITQKFTTELARISDEILSNFADLIVTVLDYNNDMFLNNPNINVDGVPDYTIDFVDMIYFPVHFNMAIPYSIRNILDTILVDECISGTNYIVTNKGNKTIKELFSLYKENQFEEIEVKTYNENTKQIEFKPIVNVVEKGIKDIYEVETINNDTIQATSNHPFMTQNGWKKLEDLKPGVDYVYISKNDNNIDDNMILVKSITSCGTDEVYDMEVSDNHNFFATKNNDNNSAFLVHNCQDLSQLQQLFIKKLDTGNNRFIYVGDKFQSIYGFNGADTKAMSRIVNNFNPKNLPLSICYRCPAKVVKLAQELVPDIEYNREREDKGHLECITYTKLKKMIKPGDIIIGRKNRDLLKIYKNFVLTDKTRIKFKNAELVNTLTRNVVQCIKDYMLFYARNENIYKFVVEYMQEFTINTGYNSSTKEYADAKVDFIKKYHMEHADDYAKKKIMKSNQTLEYLKKCMQEFKDFGTYKYIEDTYHDFYDIILEFIDEYKKEHVSDLVTDFIKYLEDFLNASNSYVDTPIISSVHSMKGGEAERVFIYDYPRFPYVFGDMDADSTQQEKNLQYVAITRAKKELFLVLIDTKDIDEDRLDMVQKLNDSCIRTVNRINNET